MNAANRTTKTVKAAKPDPLTRALMLQFVRYIQALRQAEGGAA